MPLALASAIPILAIILALLLGPVLDAETRRWLARRDRALAQLRKQADTKEVVR